MGFIDLTARHIVRVRNGTQTNEIVTEKSEFIVGRDPDTDVPIDSGDVSRKHALIRVLPDGIVIKDLGSSNGTFIGKLRLEANKEFKFVNPNMEIGLGDVAGIIIKPYAVALPKAQPLRNPEKEAAEAAVIAGHKGIIEKIEAEARDRAERMVQEAVHAAEQQRAQIISSLELSKSELERVKAMVGRVNYDHQAGMQQLATLNQEVGVLRTQREHDQAEVVKAREELLRIQNDRAENETLVAQMKISIRESEQTLSELTDKTGEIKRIREDLERISKEHHQAVQCLSTLHDQLASGRKQSLEEQSSWEEKLHQFKSESQALEREKSALKGDLAEFRKGLDHAKEELSSSLARRKEVEKEAERIEGEIRRLKTDQERIATEHGNDSRELAALKVELEALGARKKATQAEAAESIAKIKAELERFNGEKNAADRKLEELSKSTGELERKRMDQESKLAALKKSLQEVESKVTAGKAELAELDTKTRKAREETKDCEEQREVSARELREFVEKSKHTIEVQAAEDRKREALSATLDAEFKSRSLGLEARIQETELKRIEAERVLSNTVEQRAQLEKEMIAARATTEGLEKRAAAAKASAEESDAAIKASRERIAALEAKEKELQAEVGAEKERLVQAQATSVETKKTMEAELEASRQKRTAEIETEVRLRRETMNKDMIERAKKIDMDLAESHRKELERLKKLEAEEERALMTKSKYIAADITAYVVELGRKGGITIPEEEVHDTVSAVLAGKSAAGLNAAAVERTRRFWRRLGMIAAGPALVGLVLALFPDLPSLIGSKVFHTVASNQDNGGVFLQQIRQKGARYQVDMDRNYRASYADNVLYLEGYTEMKLDDGEQRKWTLDLNDFITGRLGLSDRVVVDFIGAEAVLVKELIKTREAIVPQFKDQGIARMAEVEKTESGKMLQILESPEGYEKFRVFEKSYYDDYMSRKRGLASSPGGSEPAPTAPSGK